MILITKNKGAELQALLDVARDKGDANAYRSGPVYEQIKTDFHEKCYLCEDDEQTSIQIEHFEPHKDDAIKKYDWNNLFYSCGHCNGVKGARYWPLLSCIDSSDQVWESIEIRFSTLFPKAMVEIKLSTTCPKQQEGENTRSLLEKALAGKDATSMQRDQAAKLRRKMLRIHKEFSTAIVNGDMAAVRVAVSDSSPFAGMLRWHLKIDYPHLFEQVMPLTPALADKIETVAE